MGARVIVSHYGGHLRARLYVLLIAILLAGCTQDDKSQSATDSESNDGLVESKSRTLRVSVLSWEGFESIPWYWSTELDHQLLIQKFAKANDYQIQWIRVNHVGHLINSIRNRAADVAVAEIAMTDERRELLTFTTPLANRNIQLIGVSAQGQIGVDADVGYLPIAESQFPMLEAIPVEPRTQLHELADFMLAGQFDATLVDEDDAAKIFADYPSLHLLGEVKESMNFGWIVNTERDDLKRELDEYLWNLQLGRIQPIKPRSWNEVLASGNLRVIVVDGPVTFHVRQGGYAGLEYDLLTAFADQLNLELEPIVVTSQMSAMDLLQEGHAEIALIGHTTVTNWKREGIVESNVVVPAWELLVSRDAPIRELTDFTGKSVHVPADSIRERHLRRLAKAADFQIVPRQSVSTEWMLDEVASGEIDATVANMLVFSTMADFNPGLHGGWSTSADHDYRWLVRVDQPELLTQLNDWLAILPRTEEYKNTLRNNTPPIQSDQHGDTPAAVDFQLTRLELPIRQLAKSLGMEWQLVAAHMFEESKTSAEDLITTGAGGPLRVSSHVAREFNVEYDKLADPRIGMEIGLRYFDWLRQRFPTIESGEQQWFALAAFHSGVGHVRSARKIAGDMGLDPNVWFDNVELAMPKLAIPEFHREIRSGYFPGEATVQYVKRIKQRFEQYVAATSMDDAAAAPD